MGPCREVIVVKRTVTLLNEKVSDLKASALGNLTRTMSPRKASLIGILCPYRKPTQVDRGKSPKGNEKTILKELGKLTP